MRTSPLSPETLASVCVLTEAEQEKRLRQFLDSSPPFSYDPVRQKALALLGVSTPIVGVVQFTRWTTLEPQLSRAWKGRGLGLEPNLNAAKALHDFHKQNGTTGYELDFKTIRLGRFAGNMKFWHDGVVLSILGRPTVLRVDPRKPNSRLMGDARQVVLSMMDVHIRQQNPDFRDLQLAILQLDYDTPGVPVLIHTDRDVTLLPMVDLQPMIDKTFDILKQILDQQTPAQRQRAERKIGALFRNSP